MLTDMYTETQILNVIQDIGISLGEYFHEENVGRGACIGDYDNDGDLDIIAGEEQGKLNFYENTGTSSNYILPILPPIRNSGYLQPIWQEVPAPRLIS